MAPHLPDHCWKVYYLNESCREEEDIMSNSDQVWEEYLSRKPNLSKWLQCSEQDSSFYDRILFMQDKIGTGGKTEYGRKVADLDDGEALAYFIYPNTYFNVNLLVDSKAIKHVHQPSISLEEAKLLDGDNAICSYSDLLCVRELDGDFTSKESLADMAFTDHVLTTLDNYVPHMVWDTEHDLIRTAIEYDSDYCSLFEARCNKVIDSDYLDHYLLAPKPNPTDIDRDTWHRMSVKLINWLDEDNRKTQSQSTRFFKNDLLGFMSDGLASCFLTHNLEDLSFMKTVYDFCASIPHYKFRSMRKSYHPGMLDPELFDLLREHEAVFVRPLLEQALKD